MVHFAGCTVSMASDPLGCRIFKFSVAFVRAAGSARTYPEDACRNCNHRRYDLNGYLLISVEESHPGLGHLFTLTGVWHVSG